VDARVAAVCRRLADAITEGTLPCDARLGEITLRPHQLDAVRRVLRAVRAHGGALLADAPGLGKTYVALAVARAMGGAVVAAPAMLRAQWLRSADRAAVRIAWCSLETLSRRPVTSEAPLLIVDEAHHVRTTGTRRYAHIAALAVGKPVVLLSATPVHNRPADRVALLALFLGSAAHAVPPSVLARLIVRREADAALMPARTSVRWLTPPSSPALGAMLRALPPPLPAADGRQAVALVRLTLAHAWSSSLAALDAALRRALHHAAALDDALSAGRWPTRRELRAWVTHAAASQLAFPELMAAPATGDIAQARELTATHRRALAAIRSSLGDARDEDAEARAALLRRVLQRHQGATVVAFSRYAGTIDALWRVLRCDAGVVAITARGVRSAGGGLRRRDVLAALASPAAAADARMPMRLVLCTELLGEGVDLSAASVIVHLDQPWTPARLDQREGRATRLGSPHRSIAVYAVRPPRGAARMLALAERLRAKRASMDASVSAGAAREEVLAFVRPWLRASPGRSPGRSCVAAVTADVDGWIAALRDARGQQVVVTMTHGMLAEDDALLMRALRHVACGEPTSPNPLQVRAACAAIRRWARADASAQLALAPDGEMAARAAVARRLDAAVRLTPLHQRALLQPRIAAARARIMALRGAGVERALADAARHATTELLLDAVERIGGAKAMAACRPRRPRLLALLLLVNDPRSQGLSGLREPSVAANLPVAARPRPALVQQLALKALRLADPLHLD